MVLLVSLAVMTGYWVYQGGHRGRLIEVDRAEPQSVEFIVDVNSADWPELTLLPGVGETLARRIVDSRNQEGPFLDHGDLERVRGIGPKTVEKIRPYLLPMPDANNVAGN